MMFTLWTQPESEADEKTDRPIRYTSDWVSLIRSFNLKQSGPLNLHVGSVIQSSITGLLNSVLDRNRGHVVFVLFVCTEYIYLWRWNRVSVSAHSAGAYTATLLLMVIVVKEGGPAPPPLPARLILPSWWNVRQKAAVTTLCNLWLYTQSKLYIDYPTNTVTLPTETSLYSSSCCTVHTEAYTVSIIWISGVNKVEGKSTSILRMIFQDAWIRLFNKISLSHYLIQYSICSGCNAYWRPCKRLRDFLKITHGRMWSNVHFIYVLKYRLNRYNVHLHALV